MTAESADDRTAPAEARDLAAARRVVALAGEGMRRLGAELGHSFTKACDLLAGVEGKVVVSGMGKSGHIANKIAATLASTGTPAHYLHPAEASHGDLGMIGPGDVLMVLSNSGETAELGDLVGFARLSRVPMVAIVGRAESSLAEAAEAALVLPAMAEACPLGLAPTTSTTAMLVLGDALAVALMERRGFSADHFQVLHPGGRLGRRFVKVEDIMHTGSELPLTAPEAPMSEAILVMTEKRFGCLGVTDPAGRLLGIITDGDLRRHMGTDLLDNSAGGIMTTAPKTIRPKALAAEALGFMNANSITSLFVAEDGVPEGIVHIHDILRAGIA
ncbi:MAG: KpsF/GutQ family sugar-phosphate isomerase [Alphaproteobacteria bacterium]|jgi:arabinose-5-phosphate isomerase|nr:KpsF/GutQ family sugar-phosphate isomerase [Alphaproteobacteria bacterium]